MNYWFGVLKVVLHDEVVVHSMQHLNPNHLVVGVVYVHLGRVKETKLEVEGVVFCVECIW